MLGSMIFDLLPLLGYRDIEYKIYFSYSTPGPHEHKDYALRINNLF
jgi:hypothetical protein